MTLNDLAKEIENVCNDCIHNPSTKNINKLVKNTKLYYEMYLIEKLVPLWNRGEYTQPQLGKRLDISSYKVSALLKKAQSLGYEVNEYTNQKDIDRKELLNLWNSGAYSMNKLGKHFNVSNGTIKAHLDRARSQGYEVNEKLGNTNQKNIDRKELLNLWNSGAYSMNKLGKHFNVSNGTIKAHLDRARSQGYEVNEKLGNTSSISGSKQLINAACKSIEYSSALDIHIASQIKKLMNKEKIMSSPKISEYLGVPVGKIDALKTNMSLRGEYLNGYEYESRISAEEEIELFNTVVKLNDQGISIQKICDLTGESRRSIYITVYKNYK